MAAIVSLRSVVDEMDTISDQHFAYLNSVTGELVTLSQEELSAAEEDYDPSNYPELEEDSIAKAKEVLDSDDYLPLPDRFDIDEWAIMERFARSLENSQTSDILFGEIRGRGAFRRFKDTIHRFGISNDWYRFRTDAMKEIAREWLENHGIPYVDDDQRR